MDVLVRHVGVVLLVRRIDVHELHHEVGIRAGCRHPQRDLDLAAERHVRGQRFGLVREHIGARAEAALVVAHVLVHRESLDARPRAPPRHRLGGIADVGVAPRVGHAFDGELAALLEVQRRPLRMVGGPLGKTHPLLLARVEHVRLGQSRVEVTRDLEEVLEERRLDVALELRFERITKPDVAVQGVHHVLRRPPAMAEGAHHERVVDAGVLLLDRLVDLQWSVEIFGVIPATHRHHRRLHVIQVRRDGALLPVRVVVGVRDELLPEIVVLVVPLGRVLQRAESQLEVVVGGEPFLHHLAEEPRLRRRPRGRVVPEDRIRVEVALRQRAVVVEVLEVEIRHRRLW